MPKVGNKHFSYTPKGIAQAKRLAKKSGRKVEYRRKPQRISEAYK